MRILALVFALSASAVSAQDILCHVVGVTDGDTLTCLTADQQQIKTRLARIDAPEKRQPYGERSRQSLAGMVFDRDVRLDVLTTDRYGRVTLKAYASTTRYWQLATVDSSTTWGRASTSARR